MWCLFNDCYVVMKHNDDKVGEAFCYATQYKQTFPYYIILMGLCNKDITPVRYNELELGLSCTNPFIFHIQPLMHCICKLHNIIQWFRYGMILYCIFCVSLIYIACQCTHRQCVFVMQEAIKYLYLILASIRVLPTVHYLGCVHISLIHTPRIWPLMVFISTCDLPVHPFRKWK